jgi:hypothetical protein
LFKAPREDGSRFRAELDCKLTQVQQSNLNKNENKKYDNSALKKFDQPLALARWFPPHPAGAGLFCALAKGTSSDAGTASGAGARMELTQASTRLRDLMPSLT